MPANVEIDQLWDFSDPAKSEEKFSRALAESPQAWRAEILTQLARAQGLQRKFTEAHATLDEAQSLSRDEMVVARIRLLLERGRVFNSADEIEKAKPLFTAAWELGRASGEDSLAIDAAHMLGICMPPEEAIVWNEKALSMAEQSADPRARNWAGSLYNNMGWTYHDKSDYSRALQLFEAGLKFRREKKQERETAIAQWCVARALRSLGRVQEALAIQEELWSHRKEGDEIGFILEEFAECRVLLNQPEEARRYFALAHAELSKDPWFAKTETIRLERMRRLAV